MTSATAVTELLDRHGLQDLGDALREYLAQQRWFGGKEHQIEHVSVEDVAEINGADPVFLFLVVSVHYDDGGSDLYSVPIGIRDMEHPMSEVDPRHRITTIQVDDREQIVYDALADNDCSVLLWREMVDNRERSTAYATLRAEGRGLAPLELGAASIRLVPGEQSNTSLSRDNEEFLKWVRRIDAGPSVELEMLDALKCGGFAHMASPLGGIDYLRPDQAPTRIAFLQEYLHNASEGWALALTSLRDLYADAEEEPRRTTSQLRAAVSTQGAAFTPESARLGEVTAEMHLALAWPGLTGTVAPSGITEATLNQWADIMVEELDRLLASSNPAIDPLRERREFLAQYFESLRAVSDAGLATRIHGDYHLGQVLRTDSGWTVLDFEGEPARPSAERRLLWSPLRDVAGMLRSFDYASAAALVERIGPEDVEWDELFAQGHVWAQANRDAFWHAYIARVGQARLLPRGDNALVVRRAFEVQKAIYEISYELGHRPEWVAIPLGFLLRLAK